MGQNKYTTYQCERLGNGECREVHSGTALGKTNHRERYSRTAMETAKRGISLMGLQ